MVVQIQIEEVENVVDTRVEDEVVEAEVGEVGEVEISIILDLVDIQDRIIIATNQ